MPSPARFAVVGGGIIGVATARELTRRFPGAEVTVFEKEPELARHQTGHNSGVVHAGLYYQPGSLKARLCRRGAALLAEFAAEHAVPFERCGKVVVALDPEELPRLRDIHARARANGVPGVSLVGPAGLGELEPQAVGLEALHSPATAIVDYPRLTERLAADLRGRGGAVRLGAEVVSIAQRAEGVRISTPTSSEVFDAAIVCAGLQSDRLGRLAGGARSPAIIPFFGQYLRLGDEFRTVTRGLVYPVPDPRYPFLGVHLTKRVGGEMTIGPNAFLSPARERYTGVRADARDVREVLREPGFWRFAGRNLPAAVSEGLGVLSSRRLVRRAARYVPAIADAPVTSLPRGVRAQAVARDGTLVDDFVIEHRGAVALLRNAPSPGATASLAIAEHLVQDIIDARGLPAAP
ncbi:L-2-hydroxyglutarate oxidase [Leucobacter allii]|uniref:L-2-hydroxyglutarate oxidase n=1 Tax=Leucobacter allii TaxID=2932247 RepID=UPI001FD428BE|nr:L-2-hydroxyglutarate oxidase [Leucobacter allii]UOR01374.1 L-2-hydroxyglutarate oxidase [Leucobacter allii]